MGSQGRIGHWVHQPGTAGSRTIRLSHSRSINIVTGTVTSVKNSLGSRGAAKGQQPRFYYKVQG